MNLSCNRMVFYMPRDFRSVNTDEIHQEAAVRGLLNKIEEFWISIAQDDRRHIDGILAVDGEQARDVRDVS